MKTEYQTIIAVGPGISQQIDVIYEFLKSAAIIEEINATALVEDGYV